MPLQQFLPAATSVMNLDQTINKKTKKIQNLKK